MKIYTRAEKFSIARHHLIPKQEKRHGLNGRTLKIDDDALYAIIDEYTAEAGVRQLERMIAKCCRRAAKEIVCDGKKSVRVTMKNLSDYVGTERMTKDKILPESEIGTVCGMAYTELGGEIMRIEALSLDGAGKVELTGSLGNVMRESAQAAMSFVRSRAEKLGIDPDFYRKKDIHIHFPEGAVPKDGPSAGVAIAIAIISELTGIAVRRDVAMTGEITLRGRVLAIGGLREKTMAAYLAGVKTIILPEENRKDENEILPEVKENVEIVYISHADEAIKLALCAEPKAAEKSVGTEEKTEKTYISAGESHSAAATIEAGAAEKKKTGGKDENQPCKNGVWTVRWQSKSVSARRQTADRDVGALECRQELADKYGSRKKKAGENELRAGKDDNRQLLQHRQKILSCRPAGLRLRKALGVRKEGLVVADKRLSYRRLRSVARASACRSQGRPDGRRLHDV